MTPSTGATGDAFLALFDDAVEIESRLAAMARGYHGHAGLRPVVGRLPRHLGHISGWGHGADSATPLVDPSWHPVKWRNGKVVWWRSCSTEAEALEAVGLSE